MGVHLKPAVFLDRDGVINEAIVRNGRPYPPNSLSEVVLTADADRSLQRLKQHGFLILVITNQPDIARGSAVPERINEIHSYLSGKLPIDDIFVCPHDDADNCNCRKPLPGLIFQAAQKYGIDLPASFVVGDRWRDIDAGAGAGCRTVFVDRHYQEPAPSRPADLTVSSISEAVDWIIDQLPEQR